MGLKIPMGYLCQTLATAAVLVLKKPDLLIFEPSVYMYSVFGLSACSFISFMWLSWAKIASKGLTQGFISRWFGKRDPGGGGVWFNSLVIVFGVLCQFLKVGEGFASFGDW